MQFIRLQEYQLGHRLLKLYVPDADRVKEEWSGQHQAGGQSPFPYWTQVWPSALTMAEFLLNHPEYVKEKEILELAAGLGLPSLAVADKAKKICCSDYLPEAVETMRMSVEYNELKNVECRLLDWNELPEDLKPDVLLLSDINYDPSGFDVLYEVIKKFLEKKATVLLSTPQRLMGAPFINRLLPWCIHSEEVSVEHKGMKVPINLMVLAI
jgi:predicted nicotinamide N-methyase